MMLSRDECQKALEHLKEWINVDNVDDLFVFKKLINEHCELIEYNKQLQDKVDKYKHEYYSECDRAEYLEKALDKAAKELSETMTIVTNEGYFIDDFEDWKEWCFK